MEQMISVEESLPFSRTNQKNKNSDISYIIYQIVEYGWMNCRIVDISGIWYTDRSYLGVQAKRFEAEMNPTHADCCCSALWIRAITHNSKKH